MKKVWEIIKKIYRGGVKILNLIEKNFLIIFTAFVGFAILIEIILRGFSIQGSKTIEEISRLMLVTTTFVGTSVAVKTKGHVGMSALVNALPPKAGNVIEMLSNLICAGSFLFLAHSAGKWTLNLIKLKRTMDSASFPLWPWWVVITAAFLTTGVRFLIEIGKVAKNMKSGVHEEAELKEL